MPTSPPTRHRLRLDQLGHDVTHDGRCVMTVRLGWGDDHHEVALPGLETQQGRLRATAQATLGAAQEAAADRVTLQLVGVKGVRAFDGWVIIARINATDQDGAHRLLGAASSEDEDGTLRATAKAVLDATNRLFERLLST